VANAVGARILHWVGTLSHSTMLPLASTLLLGTAVGTALLVALAARLLLRHRTIVGASRSRRARGGTIAVQLVVGGAIALAAFAIFVEVTDNIIDRDELFRIDAWIGAAVAPMHGAAGLAAARVVSVFGRSAVMTALALLLAVTLYRADWRALAVDWLLVVAGGKLMEHLLKHFFQRARPMGAPLESYSYPSGHAMGAMIGYGILAYFILLRVRRPAARIAITALAGLLILAVGASRVILGVHFATDVVGGYAAGATWLVLSIASLEAERGGRRVSGAPAAALDDGSRG
jgi:membrane-associated phospholipid phosphatase